MIQSEYCGCWLAVAEISWTGLRKPRETGRVET